MKKTLAIRIKLFLWWCSTANSDILKYYPTQYRTYSIIGSAVLLTWTFATLSWTYFFSTVVNNPFLYVLIGVFFGLGILVIDRVLIFTMKAGGFYSGNGKQIFINISAIIIRLSLALLIGNFLAQPLVLFAFKKDISIQTNIDNGIRVENKGKQLNSLNLDTKKYLKNENSRLRTIDSIQNDRKIFLQNQYLSEADGTGGSGKVGYEKITRAKKQEYLKEDSTYHANKKYRDSIILMNNTLLNSIVQNDSLGLENFKANELKDSGFLTQIDALANLMEKKPELKWRYYLIIFIIILFEIIPVISKAFIKSSVYDEKLDEIESRKKNEIFINRTKDEKIKKIKIAGINLEGSFEYTQTKVDERINDLKLAIDEVLQKWEYKNSNIETETSTASSFSSSQSDESTFSEKSMNMIEVILAVIFLFILVFIFQSGNIGWYIYISFISLLYTLSKDLNKYFKIY